MAWRRVVVVALIAAAGLVAAVPAHSSAPVYRWQVIGPARTQPTFYWPSAVAVDSRGRIDVLDRGNARIVQLSPTGQVIRQWGGRGSGPGRFGPPTLSDSYSLTLEPPGATAMAVDRRDNVYVADAFNSRIEKFSPTGTLLAIWPQGSSRPVSLAFGPRGALFVAEAGADTIVKLSPAGKVLATWTNLKAGKYSGLSPDALTVGADGRVFVRLNGGIGGCSKHLCWDRWFSYVEIYSPAGRPQRTLSITTCSQSGVSAACPLISDRQGRVLAVTGASQITRLSPAGNALTLQGGPAPKGYAAGADGVAFDQQGNLYVAQGSVDQISKFSPDGAFRGSWGIAGNGPGQVFQPASLAANARGMLAVVDKGNERIQMLSSDGTPLSRWAIDPLTEGLEDLNTIALDEAGNVYRVIQDARKARCVGEGCGIGGIVKYSPAGRILARWTPHLRPAFEPAGIAVGPHGVLDVLDEHYRVIELSPAGRLLTQWRTASDTLLTGGIAVGSQGRTYVVEGMPPGSLGDRIEVFDGGKRSAMWTGLPDLAQLAVGPSGALYAAELSNDRIIKLSPAGKVWGRWGKTGYKPGHFNKPFGVAVDGVGNLYVADQGNDRIQKRSAGPLTIW